MSYVAAALSSAAALTWPLWQESVPPGWGEWPLNIAVMAFCLALIRILVAFVQSRDKEFTAALESIGKKHEKAVDDLAAAFKEVGKETIAAVRKTTQAVEKHDKFTRRAVTIIETAARKPKKK